MPLTKHQLADELRNFFAYDHRVPRKKMNMFTDKEIINMYNTCDCCNQDILDSKELTNLLKQVNNLEEFFEAMAAEVMLRTHKEDDDDEITNLLDGIDDDYQRALLN